MGCGPDGQWGCLNVVAASAVHSLCHVQDFLLLPQLSEGRELCLQHILHSSWWSYVGTQPEMLFVEAIMGLFQC